MDFRRIQKFKKFLVEQSCPAQKVFRLHTDTGENLDALN